MLWDDAKGRRHQLSKAATKAGTMAGSTLVLVDLTTLPKGAKRVVVAWSGKDVNRERLVMGGRWTRK